MMLGLNQQQAMAAVGQNCERVFKHAHLRSTFKGVAEVVKVACKKVEEEKMQLE
jgi:RNase P/RNase MRP subunit p30